MFAADPNWLPLTVPITASREPGTLFNKEHQSCHNGMSSCILSIFPAGAVGPSLQVHNGLDLKQIQLDSLGYLISRHLQTCAHFDQAKEQFNNTLRFFGGNYKDVSICNSLH